MVNMQKFASLPQSVGVENNNNTRHLGGYKTAGGKKVAGRNLIRTGSPGGFSDKDVAFLLSEYRLRHVVDLRTEYERSADASLESVPGVSYSALPLSADAQQSIGFNREACNILIQMVRAVGGTAEAALSTMKKVYADIVNDEILIERTRKIFDILLENEGGCVMYHCAGGKDRTGVMSALILSALGVDWNTVAEDYLLTNIYINDAAVKSLEEVMGETDDPEVIAGVKYFLFAHEGYLEYVLSTVKSKYGSMESYLGQVLGLTPQKTAKLRAAYTENN
jgi:protein-tyrosine phosphatase